MADPLISIVTATYNRAHLLPQTIESVLAQTYTNWDLILVDDNSVDNTQEIIERYRKRDGRIRCVRNDRYSHSPAGAKNRGLDENRGDYIAFLDSDDTWPEYHLREFSDHLQANPDVDWVFGDIRRVDDLGNVVLASKIRETWRGRKSFVEELRGDLHVLNHERLLDNALRYSIPAPMQVSLMRSQVFERVKLRDVYIVEDTLLILEAAAAGIKFAYVDKIHLNFLVHNGNITDANRDASYARQLKANKSYENLFAKLLPAYIPMTSERKKILRNQLAEHLVWALGNNVYRASGHRREAALHILRGIWLSPWRLNYWKTLLGSLIRP